MKKIICAALALAMCATAALGFSGCGCNDKNGNSNKPGYVVPTTQPDLKDENFGYYIISSEELMLTTYFGSSKDIVIPEKFQDRKITIIGHSVFNNEDITSVEIPDTVTEIQDYAFASNNNLKSVKMSKNLKVMGTNVFFACRSLESIELPDTLKKIGPYAFAAAGLKSVTIPESTTFSSLDQYVFYQCGSLSEVTLPVTMTNIADDTFDQCAPDLTFKCRENSYGESYAKSHGYKFEAIK